MGRHAIDLTGKRFGNLVVLRRQGTSDSGGQVIWKCQCDCGGTHTVLGQALRKGQALRCPACIKAGRSPTDPTIGRVIVVRLWCYMAGETGGFATARDLETGELLAHSNWSRRPIGAQPWQGYGPLRYVLKRLVHQGYVKPKPAQQATERWAKANAIRLLEPSWITARSTLDELWAECLGSGRGPKIVELDRGPNERRVAATSTLIEDPR